MAEQNRPNAKTKPAPPPAYQATAYLAAIRADIASLKEKIGVAKRDALGPIP